MTLRTPLALAIAALTPLTSLAQNTQEAPALLEEVLVTATKRETSLMETPVAITAITGSDLVKQGITSALQIEKTVPNLKVQDSSTQGMGAVQMSMRGIGNSNFTEQGDPNVGFHVDGVYLPRPQAAINLMFDVERVEVLRGPQGTLFGRNSTVGTINVIPSKPNFDETHVRLEGQLGSFNDQVARGMLNLPLSDSLAIRATAFWQQRDSYYNLEHDPLFNAQNDSGEYIYKTNNPIFANGEGFGEHGINNPYLLLGDPTDKKRGAGSLNHQAYRLSALWQPIDQLSWLVSYDKYRNESPAAPLTVRANPHTAYLDTPHQTDMSIASLRSVMTYQFDDFIELKYTAGQVDYQHDMLIDLDAGAYRYRSAAVEELGNAPQSITFWDRPMTNEAKSHELQISSTYDAPIQWIVGLFNFKETTTRNLWIDLPNTSDGMVIFPQPGRNAESQAVFANVKWDINSDWQFSLGARHTQDEKSDSNGARWDRFPASGDRAAFGLPIAADLLGISDEELLALQGSGQAGIDIGLSRVSTVFEPIAASKNFDRLFNSREEWSNTDYSATLNYFASSDHMVYGTVATGYKSGTFQDTYHLPRTGEVLFPVLKPEELINYELGIKSNLLNDNLRLSANAYFMDYQEKQEAVNANLGDRFCPYSWADFNRDGLFDDRDFGATTADGYGNLPAQFRDPNSSSFNSVFAFMVDDLNSEASQALIETCAAPNFNLAQFPLDFVELVPLNISDAQVAGIELEWQWALTANSRFNGFITATAINEIKDVDTSEFPFILTDTLACAERADGCPDISSVKGNELPYMPDLSLNLNYAYDFHLNNAAKITAGANMNYSSSYWLSVWNVDCYTTTSGNEECNNGDQQKDYATLDLNVRYTPSSENWYAEAYGLNVTDEAYATFARRDGGDAVTTYAFSAPAQFGVRFGWHFQ